MNILQQIYDAIKDAFQSLWAWLERLGETISQAHIYLWNFLWEQSASAIIWIAELFPDASNHLGDAEAEAVGVLTTLSEYMIVMNYFINLPILGACLSFLLVVGTAASIVSMIKMIWELIPVA